MKRTLTLALFAMLGTLPAYAFDRVVHYDVVYAVAIANGFPPEKASIIARASQSLDNNSSTTAFEFGLIPKEISDVRSGRVTPSELPHMRSGQVFHALTEERTFLEQAHIARIEAALRDPDIKENRRLLYLGEYLHFVADVVVHPTDPLLGHAPQGHIPDRADINTEKLLIATAVMNEKVKAFIQDEKTPDHPTLAPTRREELSEVPRQLDPDDPRKSQFLYKVDAAVSDSWARTYPAEQIHADCTGTRTQCAIQDLKDLPYRVAGAVNSVDAGTLKTAGDLYLDHFEEIRQARAASEIARVVNEYGRETNHPDVHYTVYHPEQPRQDDARVSPGHGFEANEERYEASQSHAIPMNSNGQPIGPFAERDFGPTPDRDQSFADQLANSPELKSEREHAVTIQALRADIGIDPREAARAATGSDAAENVLDEERKAAAWVPPSSPGGIALNPKLHLPLDDLGVPQRIDTDGKSILLVTDKGSYVFDGVSVRSFATIARTVAVGQIPYLSIGSERSEKSGYARVTYAPALKNTAEGMALYDADIQFKTIFARLPLARGVNADTLAPLFADFPGLGGDFVRLWITSSNIELGRDGNHLVTVNPGMRINSETRLNFVTRDDPEMDAYTANLTAHWGDLARALPPFRTVQSLALTTAIVFWARDHAVPIDPVILTVPPETSLTPDYAPLVGALNDRLMVSGGVALTPEDRDVALGRSYLTEIRALIDQMGTPAWMARLILAAGAAVIIALALLLPSLLLWWILGEVPLSRVVRVWAGVCAAEIVIVALLRPLILGDVLSFFDSNLLALIATLVLFPILLFASTTRWLTPRLEPAQRRTVLAVGLLGPLIAGTIGLGLATVTIALTGTVPSEGLNRVLTAEVSPFEAFGDGIGTITVAPGESAGHFLPVPRSLLETQRPDFVLNHFAPQAASEIHPGEQSAFFPAATLKKIEWPANRQPQQGTTYYSIDGKPPF